MLRILDITSGFGQSQRFIIVFGSAVRSIDDSFLFDYCETKELISRNTGDCYFRKLGPLLAGYE